MEQFALPAKSSGVEVSARETRVGVKEPRAEEATEKVGLGTEEAKNIPRGLKCLREKHVLAVVQD